MPPCAARRSAPPAVACTHTLTRTRARRNAVCACAHAYAHICTHCYVHTHVPSSARLVRALTTHRTHARPRIGASAGNVSGGGGGTHRILRLGQSAAAGSSASSVFCAYLRANRAAAPGGSDPPLTARRSRTRRSTAPRRHRCERAWRRRGGRGTHRSSKSMHWPSHSGSAFTFVEATRLPRTARACGPRPPRNNGRTWGRTGRSHRKSPRMHAHTHARDRHTGAFGSGDCTLRQMQTTRAHPRAHPPQTLGAAPKYVYLNIDGCPHTLMYIFR